MGIAAAFDLEIRQYDAINAFPNAVLPTLLACYYAEGYERSGYLLWVLRALYRLKTSPLLWYKEFTVTLEDLGLHLVPNCNCLYVNDWMILIFYVDNILILYALKHQLKIDQFEQEFLNRYKMR